MRNKNKGICMENIKLSQSNMAYISRATAQKPTLVEQPPVEKKKNGKKLIFTGLIAVAAVGAAAILISKNGGVKKIFDKIKSSKNIDKGATNLGQDISDATKKAVQDVSDAMDKAVDSVGEAINKTNDSIGEKLSDVVNKTADKSIVDDLINDNAAEAVSKVADEAANEVANKTVNEVAEEVANKVVNKTANEVADEVASKANDAATVVEEIQQKPKKAGPIWPPEGNGKVCPDGRKITYQWDKDNYFIGSTIVYPDGSKEIKTFEPSLRHVVPRHAYGYDANGKPTFEKDIMMTDINKISSWSVYKMDNDGNRYDRIQKRFFYDEENGDALIGYEKRHELEKNILTQVEEFDAKGQKIREYLEDKRRR